jgi:hypothetical protein
MIRPASRERIKDTALARISQGLAAMRDFSTANVSLGSKPEVTALQQQWPVHLSQRT